MNTPLDPLRRRIDQLDREMVDLLVERLKLALEIGRTKQQAGQPPYDPERERRVLERAVEAAAGGFPAGKLRHIFREIISAARSEQDDQMVLVHGEWGGIAHHAAFQHFGRSSRLECTTRPEDLFVRLEEGSARGAVVCFEGRSLETSLERLDLFLHSEVRVTGEVAVFPRLALYAARPEHTAGPVCATAACLAQAGRWVAAQDDGRDLRIAATLQQAIDQARQHDGAVLGYPACEALTGWAPVIRGLEDLPEARRRFHLMGRETPPPSGDDRTLVLAVLRNRAGSLHEVTRILAHHAIDLSWLEPKPTHLGAWDHLFLFELSGHQENAPLRDALPELQARAEVLRVLGSYPRESRT